MNHMQFDDFRTRFKSYKKTFLPLCGWSGWVRQRIRLLMAAGTDNYRSMTHSNLSGHANSYLQVHVLSKDVDCRTYSVEIGILNSQECELCLHQQFEPLFD